MSQEDQTPPAPARLRGKPFKKGNTGRPKGSRNKATLAAESMLAGEAEAVFRKLTEMAKAGDPVALKLYVERILSPARSRPVPLDLPSLHHNGSFALAQVALVTAASKGEISLEDAQVYSQLLENAEKSYAVKDLEEEVQRLRNILERV